MVAKKNDAFKAKYKEHPVRLKAIDTFNKNNDPSEKAKARKYMYQVMAIIGLELEDRFQEIVSFNDESFMLFGREKSQKSLADKKKVNLKKYDDSFKNALEKGNELPSEVRPIFDYYAYKFVCPEIKNSKQVIDRVVTDMLDYIGENYFIYSNDIVKVKEDMKISSLKAVEYLDSYFSDLFPHLKEKIMSIMNEKEYTNKVQNFLNSCPKDVSAITYSEYYSKIIECYNILLKLSYQESFEEIDRITLAAQNAREEFTSALEKGNGDKLIDSSNFDEMNSNLQELLGHVSRKRTSKLDLALADLMFFDILVTSNELKKLGVTYSKDPTRTKQKRKSNGYIANFYSLDMPDGYMAEIQLQSLYRYIDGEIGPAAHHNRSDEDKKRRLLPRPKDKEKYPEWAERQFKSLPRFFYYKGKGYVEVLNTVKNFKQYYKCEDKSKVQTYVEFIASHNVDLLEGSIHSFSFGQPSCLEEEKEER